MSSLFEELRAALWTVWNRRWLALCIAWGICLLGWMAVAFVPNTYESRARIFVQLDDVLAQQIGIGAGSRQKDIDRIRQTLTSSVNLEKVIRSTSLTNEVTSDREMESAVLALAKDIKVRSEGENLFEISATSGRSSMSDGENSQLAHDIVQKMIDIFREENLGGSRGDMVETLEFLDQQLAARQKDLEAAEQSRLEFESTYPQMIGGAQGLAQKVDSMRSELRSVEADLAAAQSALAAINGQLAGTPRSIIVPGMGGPRAGLAQAEASLAGMRSRGLTNSHPDMVAALKEVESLRAQVAASGSDGGTPNPAYTSLLSIKAERQANVEAMQARRAALQSEVMSVTASQAQEPGVAAQAQRISRDYQVLREQYDKLLQDREELRLRGQVENERSALKFEVVDPPATPRAPAAPNRPLLLAGVLFLGLGAGAGIAYALGFMRSTFATASKLEDTFGLPVLGTISHNVTEAGRAIHARQLKLFAAGAGGLCALCLTLVAVEFVQRGLMA